MDRKSDAIGYAILDILAIGETQLCDLLVVASEPAKYIDLLKAALRYRNFPHNVEVHGKYILALLR
jgi:hypothetical protein